MIPFKKEYLAGGLLLAAAGVWIPQFLESRTEERPPDYTGPLTNEGASTSPESPGEVESPVDEVPIAPSSSAPSPMGLEDPAGATGQDPGSQETDLAALLQSLAGPDGTSEAPEEIGAPVGDGDLEHLRAFAEATPFQGLIRGPADAIALLGHRLARVGDGFENGTIRLIEIDADHIRIAAGEATLDVPLPAFQARTTTSGEGEVGASQEQGETADGQTPEGGTAGEGEEQ